MSTIKITATDKAGQFDALVVNPTSTPAGAVVLIQEIFGVNDALQATAAQIAALGFIAIAPDLFWRQEPGVNISDKTDAEWKKAFALMNGFDQAKGVEDLKATLAVARTLPGANGRAATMGFCLGGRLAFMMATRSDADLNIAYYGVGLDGLLDELPNVKKPLLIHIAEKDEYVPPEAQKKIIAATAGNRLIHAYSYANANHAFARVEGIHYRALAATIANGRSAEALHAALA
jgi:carboxymethylenebutenolidase